MTLDQISRPNFIIADPRRRMRVPVILKHGFLL